MFEDVDLRIADAIQPQYAWHPDKTINHTQCFCTLTCHNCTHNCTHTCQTCACTKTCLCTMVCTGKTC